VGISKVHNEGEYERSVKKAFAYDTKIILEEFIKGREIECSILGNEEICASLPGEVIPRHEFYSYESKYLDENGAALKIPAELPRGTIKKIQALGIKTFRTLCCEGLSRVDFFLQDDETLFVNEINTMPGFTRISMYPKLWEVCGISYKKLIDTLIKLAIRRYKKEKKLKTNYIG
jgi:D-alanine-D-alanine ligase